MIEFKNKVLFVGYGAVAECTLPILFKHVKVPAKNVTVMDFENRAEKLLQWCRDHGVMYINTSTELWHPYASGPNAHPTTKTLYYRHMNLRRMIAKWDGKGATAVIEHGANPGLISHFVKQGLLDIGESLIADKKVKGRKAEKIMQLSSSLQFNHLARELGVKVIHCSERDTQITDKPKQVDEFVNTWSIEGFREEGTTTSEMGWGTHEQTLPKHAFQHQEGPK